MEKKKANNTTQNPVKVTLNELKEINKTLSSSLTNNSSTHLLRHEVLRRLIQGDNDRDIDVACGYTLSISKDDFQSMYDRRGIAERVVKIYPEECWSIQPEIYETEDSAETLFEKEWKALQRNKHVLSYLSRIDILSGIGDFGILFLGISDGETDLSKPIKGIDEKTGKTTGTLAYDLLYLKPFTESVVEIDTLETDPTSPRYGYPKIYSVMFKELEGSNSNKNVSTTKKIHWTRVIHIADNREMSDVRGKPRMKACFDYLTDIRKVLGGSGEMFWKGGFPGISLEVVPNNEGITPVIDADTKEDIQDELEKFYANLQRYVLVQGMTVKSLQPQVSDPTSHIRANLQAIAITLGVPMRIFMGSEEAKLASSTDKETWNSRILNRQNGYISPFIIRPFIDRCMQLGILPEVEEYYIDWPDLNTPSDKEQAEVQNITTEALAKYVQGDVAMLVPPEEFFTHILKMDSEVVKQIQTAAEQYQDEFEEEQKKRMEEEQRNNPDNNNDNNNDDNQDNQ